VVSTSLGRVLCSEAPRARARQSSQQLLPNLNDLNSFSFHLSAFQARSVSASTCALRSTSPSTSTTPSTSPSTYIASCIFLEKLELYDPQIFQFPGSWPRLTQDDLERMTFSPPPKAKFSSFLMEAFPQCNFKIWEFQERLPLNFWKTKENVTNYIDWLASQRGSRRFHQWTSLKHQGSLRLLPRADSFFLCCFRICGSRASINITRVRGPALSPPQSRLPPGVT